MAKMKLPRVVKLKPGYVFSDKTGKLIRARRSFAAQLGKALIHKAGEAVSCGGGNEKLKAELLAARRAINTALRTLRDMER